MGIFDKIVNYFGKTLKNANDKQFTANMDELANSSPEGKKAAEHYYDSVELIDRAAANAGDYNKYDSVATDEEIKKQNKEQEDELAEIRKEFEAYEKNRNKLLEDKQNKIKLQIEQLHIGMKKDMVLDVFGNPGDEKKTVNQSGEKLTWFYNGKKTSRGNMRYSLSIKIKNNKVVSWSEE